MAMDIGLFVIGAAVIVYQVIRQIRGQMRQSSIRGLVDAIRAAGLTLDPGQRNARYVHDDATVHVTVISNGDGASLRLTCAPPLDTGLTLAREGVFRAVSHLAGRGDTAVGEPRFDQVVWVGTTHPAEILAWMSPEARDATIAAVELGGTFEDGQWRTWLLDGLVDGPMLRRWVTILGRAHAALAEQAARDPLEAIADRARHDRSPGVRRAALTMLVDGDHATPSLLESADADLDPGVRLIAARARGPEGADALLRLMRTGSRTWRVTAAAAIPAHPMSDAIRREVEDTLLTALGDADLETLATEALGQYGSARVIGPLSESAAPAALRAAAQVRTRIGDDMVGGLALAHDPRGELSLAASAGGITEGEPQEG